MSNTNNIANENDFSQLKKRFDAWDPIVSHDGWNNLETDLKEYVHLNNNWNSWDVNVNNSVAGWDKLDSELDQIQELNSEFDAWEPAFSASSWDRINEELNVSVPEFAAVLDEQLVSSFDAWNPESNDNWTALNDELSIEVVEARLSSSVTTVWKWTDTMNYVAALVAIVCCVLNINDGVKKINTFESKVFTTSMTRVYPGEQKSHSNNQITSVNRISTNGFVAEIPPNSNDVVYSETDSNVDLVSIDENRIENTPVQNSEEDVVEVESPTQLKLNPLRMTLEEKNVIGLFLPIRKTPYHHWTIHVGMHSAWFRETGESDRLTTVIPKVGATVELSYKIRIRGFQLHNNLGVAQFNQKSGKYINGRHLQSDQKIQAIQFASNLAYSRDRWTFFAGPMFTKFMNGVEERSKVITKVYNFKQIHAGVTAGIDYQLVYNANTGRHLSVGAQYQFTPNIVGENAQFQKLNVVRLQMKYSF